MEIVFDGQQSDEKILAVLSPHIGRLTVNIGKILIVLIAFYLVLWAIASFLPDTASKIRIAATLLFIAGLAASIWWSLVTFRKSKTYLTDRRIMRFELLSPIYTAKRSLFWSESLKAKGYSTNILWRLLKIGTVQVEPHAATDESVRVTDIYLYEDVANYIDKIIFSLKNNPTTIGDVRPFIAKPKGQRQ